tara:strand:- start:18579 stop:19160 length:582 start_codon:yes stop_codon:yes gene_type:complete
VLDKKKIDPFDDVYILRSKKFSDERGHFTEAFNQKSFTEIINRDLHFVQDNLSVSRNGVLRGLHFQRNPHAQAKLIRVLEGKILDVIVDIRLQSPSFSKWQSIELDEEDNEMLFVPEGFAHGFLVVSEIAKIQYKTSSYYHPESDVTLRWNDKDLGVNWRLDDFKISSLIISEKDLKGLSLVDLKIKNFFFCK